MRRPSKSIWIWSNSGLFELLGFIGLLASIGLLELLEFIGLVTFHSLHFLTLHFALCNLHLFVTVRVGRGLQCLQDEVCFLCFRLLARRCHTISSITVDPLPLTEPDKRLSHTSGSSVGRSVRLRALSVSDPLPLPLHSLHSTSVSPFTVDPPWGPSLSGG